MTVLWAHTRIHFGIQHPLSVNILIRKLGYKPNFMLDQNPTLTPYAKLFHLIPIIIDKEDRLGVVFHTNIHDL